MQQQVPKQQGTKQNTINVKIASNEVANSKWRGNK